MQLHVGLLNTGLHRFSAFLADEMPQHRSHDLQDWCETLVRTLHLFSWHNRSPHCIVSDIPTKNRTLTALPESTSSVSSSSAGSLASAFATMALSSPKDSNSTLTSAPRSSPVCNGSRGTSQNWVGTHAANPRSKIYRSIKIPLPYLVNSDRLVFQSVHQLGKEQISTVLEISRAELLSAKKMTAAH